MDTIEDFRKHARSFVREFGFFKSQYEDTGASYGETHALIEFARLGELEVGELGRLLNIDKTGASKMLSQLQKKKWVNSSSLQDGRKKLFKLSAAGRQIAATIEKHANKKAKLAFDELSAEEQVAVLRGIACITGALKTAKARSEYTIRVCQPKDNAAIASIVKRSLKDLGFAGPGTAAADPSVHYLSSFNSERQCYLVAEKEGRVMGGAGVVAMKGESKQVCELVRMFLHPDARSSGLAQLLIDEVLRRAKDYGYSLCYLETTDKMKAAQALYRKNGFQYVSKRRGNTGHFACDVLMEKKL